MTTLYHPPDVAECSKAWGATCGPCSLAAALGRPVADVFTAVAELPDAQPIQGGLFKVEPQPTFRGWMTIGQMKTAVVRAGAHLDREWSPISVEGLSAVMLAEAFARVPFLVCFQWGGPWPPRAAARFRHWVALRWVALPHDTDLWVYDWNAAHLVDFRTWVPTSTSCGWCEATIEARVGDKQQRCPKCAVSGLGKAPDERLPNPWPPRAAGGWLRWSTWEEKLLPNLLPERGDGTWKIQWAGAVRP